MLTHQNKGEKKNNQLQWEERLPHVHTEIWWDFSLSTFLVFLSKTFLLHKVYHIMLFSSRVPERSHRVTSALFLMVRHLNETTIVLICFFRNCPIFCCPFMYFLLFVAHRYFCCPQVWGTCGKPSVESNHRLLGNHNCRRVGTSEVDIGEVEYWILKKHGRNIDDVGLDFSGQYWKKKST